MSSPPLASLQPPTVGLRALLSLAWPIIVSRSTQTVVGVSDAVMVAPLGESALAATTTGALNTFSLLILPMGVVFIVSTFSSQLFGKGDLEGARRYGFYGLVVALAAEVLCLAGMFATPAVVARLGYAPDVRDLMTDYLQFRLVSGGAAIGLEALANYYGGLGNTRLPMLANVAAMLLNLLGNWLLIGGRLGFPALGVRGAALASTLATTLAFVGLLLVFLRDGRKTGRIVPRLAGRELARMLRFGIPSGFNWFFEFFAFAFFVNVVVAGLGTTALAALMTVMQINGVSFMPAFGLASAGAILVGQSIGAGRKDDVPHAVRLTLSATATWQGLVGLAYFFLPELLFSAFDAHAGDDVSRLAEVGARVLALSAAWQLFDAAATTFAEALRAAGDTAFTLWARVVIAWAIFVPGSYLSVRRFGWTDRGAVFWLVLYLALLAATLYVRFSRGAWRRLDVTSAEAPPLT